MRLQSSLILALLSASAIIWLGAAQGSVVINEVEANPAGDEDAFKPLVSLFNATGAEVDRTAVLNDREDNEGAWTRDPDGRDTNSTDDWKFLASSRGF